MRSESLWHTSIGPLTLPDLCCSLMETYQGSSVIQTPNANDPNDLHVSFQPGVAPFPKLTILPNRDFLK